MSFLDLIALLIIFCSFIKSAQIGPHIWLPDSMEAPVPASALIHSATLVSAGVFLILRIFPIFERSKDILSFISVTGAVTAFFGGLISMHQSDSKKILAYSTISHCGFLIISTSLGVTEYTIIYLYVHGFFKALTFMAVGNVNRFNKGKQDFRSMGILYKLLPFEMFFCLIGLLNLTGLPFSLGFFIKHLTFVCLEYNFFFFFMFINLFLAAITGIFYCGRLFFYTFFDFKKGKKEVYCFYNTMIVKNSYYTNSTYASYVALFFLSFTSYFFSIKIIYFFSSNFFYFSDFQKNYNSSVSILNYFVPIKDLLNFYYLNFFIFFFFFFFTFKNENFFFLIIISI